MVSFKNAVHAGAKMAETSLPYTQVVNIADKCADFSSFSAETESTSMIRHAPFHAHDRRPFSHIHTRLGFIPSVAEIVNSEQ